MCKVLWRSWPHIVKLNEWTSVTAIVNFCPMTCRLCYMSTDALNGCRMGPLLVLVSPCFRENVVVTCKIGSFLCNLDNLLQKNVIVFFFENQISKWRSFEKRAIFDLLFTFFSYQGKLELPKFLQQISHSHTYMYFALYQVWFLFGVIPGVDSYSRHFGTINK